ncbi:hypothetical protein FTX61_04230 [Nitriliruptoraceae bacterium ZYF776]|nr:hypothetical protein [Profundirhabdus halotolerans]
MSSRPRAYIGELRFHEEVEAKIERKHGLSRREVESALLYTTPVEARWHTHDLFGERLIVRARTPSGRAIVCYLAPVDEVAGIWICKTAMPRRR